MRIVIDMQACQNGSRFRGIGRYTIGLVTALLKNENNNHEFILLFNGMFNSDLSKLINYFSKYISPNQMHTWSSVAPTEGLNLDNKSRKNIATLLREDYIEKLEPDFVLMTTYFEGFGDDSIFSIPAKRNYNVAVTCHDLIPLIQKDIYLDTNPLFKEYYLNQVKEFSSADVFLAVSESSKQELIKYISIPEHKIVNTLEGIEQQFKNSNPTHLQIETIIDCKLKNRKVILYSGASDERKNHLKLIKAYSLLDFKLREESILVFAGGMPKEHIEKFKKYAEYCGVDEDELRFTGRISDQEMIDLYSYCYLFIFPSFHEGFGLPALEAMSCGAATVVSNKTSLPEVVGQDNLTFDPYDVTDIKSIIEKFLKDPILRNKTAQYCIERAKFFSWEKTAQVALDYIQKSYINDLHKKNNYLKQSRPMDIVNKIKKYNLNKGLSLSNKEQIALSIIKNNRPQRKSRIYYDMSILVTLDFITGIQRVVHEIYSQLFNNYSDSFEIIPVRLTNEIEEITFGNYARPLKQRLSKSELTDYRPGDIYLNIDLNHSIHNKHHILKNMQNNGCQTCFVVHDILPLTLGESFFPRESARNHYNWLDEVSQADMLICVSKSVMEDVYRYINTFKNVNTNIKLGWFHLGADFDISKNNIIKKEKFINISFSLPTYIMVGSIEPRKGHFDAVEAFTSLWDKGYDGNLLIIGSRSWNSEIVLELIRTNQYFNKRLFLLNNVNDAELNYLYSQSSALIAASLGEGFGLPIIEAMRSGIDIITRDIPVLKEVTRNKASYFNSIEQLADLIENFKPTYINKQERNYLTWNESAKLLIDRLTKLDQLLEWNRDIESLILPICSNIFNTNVGVNDIDRIKTKRKSGLLVWGGYFPLSTGSYQLKLFGKSYKYQNINICIRAYIEGSTKILFDLPNVELSKSLVVHDIPELLSTLEINIPQSEEKIEIYIEVTDDNDLYISSFEFKKISSKNFLSLPMSSSNFGTNVGKHQNGMIFTKNKSGLLVHGGYFSLSKGMYILDIYGLAQNDQLIDISIIYYDLYSVKHDLIEINMFKISKTENKSGINLISSINFQLDDHYKELQILLKVNDNNILRIDKFHIIDNT